MGILGFVVVSVLAFGLGFWLTKRLQRQDARQQHNSPDRPPLPQPLALSLPPDLDHQVQQLLAQNQAIAAIKLVRQSTGWDLRTSKAYVDRLRLNQ
jgi:hypothetical protein